MKIAIFMPAYNAAKHLEGVVKRIPAALWPHVVSLWIINDGSTDHSTEIINRLTIENPVIKAEHFNENQGYGAAVKKGLSFCQKDDCDYAVCLHADGQYPPEYILDFVQTMEAEAIDLLQGSRHAAGTALEGGMPLYKYLAGKILVWLENKVFGLQLTDYHSGFLFYSRRAYNTIPYSALGQSFHFDLEIIATAKAKGLAIAERPIPTRYADEKSSLNPLSYGFSVLMVLGLFLLGEYR